MIVSMASGDPFPTLYPHPAETRDRDGKAFRDPGKPGYYLEGVAYRRAVVRWWSIHLFLNVILPYALPLFFAWKSRRQVEA